MKWYFPNYFSSMQANLNVYLIYVYLFFFAIVTCIFILIWKFALTMYVYSAQTLKFSVVIL